MKINLQRIFIRVSGIIIILYFLAFCIGGGIPTPAPSGLFTSALCLLGALSFWGIFISGAGIISLRKWAIYSSIISLSIFNMIAIYTLCTSYPGEGFNIARCLEGGIVIMGMIPFTLTCYLFIPRIKEKFK